MASLRDFTGNRVNDPELMLPIVEAAQTETFCCWCTAAILGEIVKYAGLNSDQVDLIFGKNLSRLLRIGPKPSAPKTMDITHI